jgi:hypothetical protein
MSTSSRLVPVWSNKNLERCVDTWATQAAQGSLYSKGAVPENNVFGNSPDHIKWQQDHQSYKKPICDQTALIMGAYNELRVVSVPTTVTQFHRLLLAETAELTAWAEPTKNRDPNAADPRAFALTLLIYDHKKCIMNHMLLDCMAYLANYERNGFRGAADVRFTVLLDNDAQQYSQKHGGNLGTEAELALVYVNDDNEIAMAKTEVRYLNRSSKVYSILQKRICELFNIAGKKCPASVTSMGTHRSVEIDLAYLRSMQSTNDDFWNLLTYYGPAPELSEKLYFDKTNDAFLKIVPRVDNANGKNMTRPNVSFGMLCYRKGSQAEMREFIEKSRLVELGERPDAVTGLKFPTASMAEEGLLLHVLHVSSDTISIAKQYSCFGNSGGVPGVKICNDTASVRRLLYSLLPYTPENFPDVFVLPCTQYQVNTTNDQVTRAQWKAAESGVRNYWRCFYTVEPKVDIPVIRLTQTEPLGEPSEEDKSLASVMGTTLFTGAFYIADVYAQLRNHPNQPMPSLCSFLQTSAARLGPMASMSSALNESVRVGCKRDSELHDLRNEVVRLKREQPVVIQPPLVIKNSSYAVTTAKRIIKGMGLSDLGKYALSAPLKGPLIMVILTCLARSQSSQLMTDDEKNRKAKWGKKHCLALAPIDAIAAVARNEYATTPIIIITFSDCVTDGAKFLLVADKVDGDNFPKTSQISAIEALEIRASKNAVVTLYYTDEAKLTLIGEKDVE